MKTKDVVKLKTNNNIIHKRYGKSKVKEVMFGMGGFFGVVITPISNKGRGLLLLDSETDIPDFLETSVRQLQPV